jgi:hypothetical protein
MNGAIMSFISFVAMIDAERRLSKDDQSASPHATIWNRPATKLLWAWMSLPPMCRICPFLIIAIASKPASVSPLNYLVVYKMESAGALKTPEYDRIKSQPSAQTRNMLAAVSGFTRYIGNQISASSKPDTARQMENALLYAVWFNVAQTRLADFDAWYEQDHVPILMEANEWIAVRRFDVVECDPIALNRLALHYITSPSALESSARQRARETPWRARLSGEPWFKGI